MQKLQNWQNSLLPPSPHLQQKPPRFATRLHQGEHIIQLLFRSRRDQRYQGIVCGRFLPLLKVGRKSLKKPAALQAWTGKKRNCNELPLARSTMFVFLFRNARQITLTARSGSAIHFFQWLISPGTLAHDLLWNELQDKDWELWGCSIHLTRQSWPQWRNHFGLKVDSVHGAEVSIKRTRERKGCSFGTYNAMYSCACDPRQTPSLYEEAQNTNYLKKEWC